MDNENSAAEKMQPNAVESPEKSVILPEKYLTMKTEIKDEALKIFAGHRDNISKPKTLTDACATMKEESKNEAKRLIPNPGDRH
jgi:hypothetical protein